jgi:methanogenic corrinoid protein MtbC1
MSRPHQQLDRRVSSYLHAVLDKDREAAEAVVQGMVDGGSSLAEIYGVLGAAQVEIGALWERGVITVSDEHFATEIALGCIPMAAEKLRKFRRELKGYAVLCPVEGEFHWVGLRMLAELLRNDGWEAELLDSAPSVSTLGGIAARKRVNLFCLSATMPSNVARAAEVINLIRKQPAFKSAKVLVGGPAFEDARTKRIFEDGLADRVTMSLPEALEFSRSVGC